MSGTSAPVKLTISVFQALLILIDKYQKLSEPEALKKLKKLSYLGVRNTEDRKDILLFLQDPALSDYEISMDYSATNQDPSRRYFETHFSYGILHSDLFSKLSIADFKKHIANLENMLSPATLAIVQEILVGNFSNIKDGKPCDLLPACEHADVIAKLRNNQYFIQLNPHPSANSEEKKSCEERREKMALIVYSTLLVSILCKLNNDSLPLNLYKTEPLYFSGNRGRLDRDTIWQNWMKEVRSESKDEKNLERDKKEGPKNVLAHTFGIMRSFTPSPRDDIALANLPIATQDNGLSAYASPYVFFCYRGPDRSTYVPDSKWAVDNFQHLTHPFVNAISGTLLMHLRVLRQLADNDMHSDEQKSSQLIFNDHTKLFNFLRAVIPVLAYTEGGHTFHEFTYPLQLPAIQEGFSFINDFASINNENLFFNGETNQAVFDEALQVAIEYNKINLARNAVCHEIVFNCRK
jgi:hypothetical protein